MKIQIASDLHLEFPENKKWLEEHPLIPKGDVLILSGDIVVLKHKDKAEQFYNQIRSQFKQIISLFGNHEFYHGEINFAYPSYFKQLHENHILLNNKIFVYKDVKFICSTLWSAIPDKDVMEIERRMNDYHVIYENKRDKIPITAARTNFFHKISVEFIQRELKNSFAGKIVVVTHHLPSFRCNTSKYQQSALNSAYVNNMDKLIEDNQQISLWVHGHSHEFNHVNIGKVILARNPLGYVDAKEEHSFKRDYIITI